MVSLLARSVGLLAKSLAGLSCTQTTRCSSLPGALSAFQHTTTRWFSKQELEGGLPKRPLTSYFRFVNEQRPIVVKQYPEANLMEISKILALEWKGLSESARKRYVDVANEELLKYKSEVRKYKEKLSPLELQLLNEKRKRKLVKRKHIRHKRELTILGKPKRSRSAYNIYMSENFQEAKATSLMEKMKSLQEEWKRLPQSQKQMYVQLAQDDKIRYENEMKAWEEQMLEIGREDLLRLKAKKRLIKNSEVMREAKSKHPVRKKVVKKETRGQKAGKRKNKE